MGNVQALIHSYNDEPFIVNDGDCISIETPLTTKVDEMPETEHSTDGLGTKGESSAIIHSATMDVTATDVQQNNEQSIPTTEYTTTANDSHLSELLYDVHLSNDSF
jgi:hypothetical protein